MLSYDEWKEVSLSEEAKADLRSMFVMDAEEAVLQLYEEYKSSQIQE